MKHYPALDIDSADLDRLYAALDDFSPTAIEERAAGVRAFFGSAATRDAALTTLSADYPTRAVNVPDDDWATRSQQDLPPVTVGTICVSADRGFRHSRNPQSPTGNPYTIIVPASRGFGTGHHATTRMCLAGLQTLDLRGLSMLDVGTGSGILAIAADRLGAARALGIDNDPDAIEAARESLSLNPEATHTTFAVVDLAAPAAAFEAADVVTANLTGALLVREATRLIAATRPGGTLILSGLMREERDAVCAAFGLPVVWEHHEDEWVGVAVKKS